MVCNEKLVVIHINIIRQVHLYPCGDKDDKEHVTCYLHHLERNEADAIAKWKASFKNKKGVDLRTPLGE